jgi:curved DNA-binding protein CbpA
MRVAVVNAYDTLQVSRTADAQVIRAAYRSLIQSHHPDRHPGDGSKAELAARLTQAYELLTDSERKAELDAQLAADDVRRSSAATAVRKSQASQKQADDKPAPAAVSVATLWPRIAILLLFAALAWAAGSYAAKRLNTQPPAQQLAELRTQMESAQTSEAQRRALFARKQELLQADAQLAAFERSQRVSDLAGRSVGLLQEPLLLSMGSGAGVSAGLPMPLVRLSVPEITLVLGSFDAELVKSQISRHRLRMVSELERRLGSEPATLALSGDAEERLKRVIRQSVVASLDIQTQESYPSTYFESPGRYGVVDVILPQSFRVLR